ncbi:SWI/SNF chromatin-remodeling complex subunit [Ceratobasidium sp. 428]|nr:SWI/SNF chromatin-remodeling complex subunit [Ceratobasidium sp. 428]
MARANSALATGMNPALSGAMNRALPGSVPPPKPSRRIVSSPGPLPSSPTKASGRAALPLPPGVNPQTTFVTALPLLKDEADITHGGALPEVTEGEMKEVKRWMGRDTAFQEVYARVREKRTEEETMSRSVRLARWEVDETSGMMMMGSKFHIWWPAEQRKMKERKMKVLGGKYLGVTKLVKLASTITQTEMLVPIRIEIDHDHYRLRDAFTWNLNDPVITPEVFAQCLCDDFQIPSATVVQAVAKSIAEQLAEHCAHIVELSSGPKRDIVHGAIGENGEEWWRRWGRKVADGSVASRDEADDTPADEEDKTMSEELRVLVKLDVIVGTMNLTDQFEWDINNPDNSPEEFAEVYCRDLGLGGEFKTAVAHSIREQASVYQKSLFLVGHPFDGTPVADDELRMAMLPPIEHSFRFDRTLLEQFTPQLNVLQEGEIERNEREHEKELKRKRRQTRGRRGVALPDREPQKTHRTPIGFAEIEITPAQQAAQQQPTVSFISASMLQSRRVLESLSAHKSMIYLPAGRTLYHHPLHPSRLRCRSPDSTIRPDSPKPQSTPLPPTAPELPASTPIVEQPPSLPSPTNPNGSTPTMATRPLLMASYSSDRVTGQTAEVPLPQWMQDCLAATQLRYPDDRVGIILKPRPQNTEEPAMPEFRLKCLSCPGKLYIPGLEQTLTNFESLRFPFHDVRRTCPWLEL